MEAGTFALICGVMFGFLLSFTPADQETITAESGQDVTLTCRAPNNNFELVEWSRADLRDEYVLVYRDGRFLPNDQHQSFENRVDLVDEEMKDGDVSLILNNVSTADSGTYECRVFMKETRSWESISNITLSVVDPPGQTGGHTEDGGKKDGGKEDGGKKDGGKEDGSVGLKVGLPVDLIVAAVVVVVGVFLIYRKAQSQGTYQVPAEQQPV